MSLAPGVRLGRARFDREARTISSLNHPHIWTLYDIGRQDGVAFLVMEYLEGQTLAERLTKGALPLDRSLRYAIETAHALDTAHRTGITHRDLKPGNIMLTQGGHEAARFWSGKGEGSGDPGRGALDAADDATQPDRARRDSGHVPVHGAGANRGRGGRCPHRRVRVRCGALRDAHRQEGVYRQDAGTARGF